MTEDVQAAYERGKQEGETHALRLSVDKAHARLDGHDGRLTALERVMYAGMGVLFLINLLPELANVLGSP